MKRLIVGLVAGIALAAGLGAHPVTVVVPGTPVPKPPPPWMQVSDGLLVVTPPTKGTTWDI